MAGTTAEVGDRAIEGGWAEDDKSYANELLQTRLRTLYYLIPTVILLFFTIKSFRQKNELLFYWTFLIGLSLFQILPLKGLSHFNPNGPEFVKPLLWVFLLTFLTGQIYSIVKLIRTHKKSTTR